MQSFDRLEEKLIHLSNFFKSVKNSSASKEIDRETADYGLSKVKAIRETIYLYKQQPKNTLLKRIHALIFSMTRGVEFFVDLNTNHRFKKNCEGIYEIVIELDTNIKW